MESRAVPVLSSADQPIVDRLAAGLSDDAARVLAYLVLRAGDAAFADAATMVEVRLGTSLGRQPAREALSALESASFLDRTTVESTSPGRPPTAWSAPESIEDVTNRVYDAHAARLLERAGELADVESSSASSTDRDGDPATRTDEDGAELMVALNWEPNALHLPLYAADATGAYDRRGLSVTFQPHVGSRRAIDAVVAGEAVVGVAGAATVAQARADDVPIAPVAALFQRSMVVIYALDDLASSGGAAALRGRHIGMPAGSETAVLGRLFLSQSGLLDDVELVDLEKEEYEALDDGDVDAVTGVFADPLRLERAGIDVDVIRVAEQYPIPGPVLIAREDTVPSPVLTAFLAGSVAGWVEATESSADAAQAVAATSDADPAHVQETFERAAAEFGRTSEVSEHGWGWLSPGDWRRLEDALSALDLLER